MIRMLLLSAALFASAAPVSAQTFAASVARTGVGAPSISVGASILSAPVATPPALAPGFAPALAPPLIPSLAAVRPVLAPVPDAKAVVGLTAVVEDLSNLKTANVGDPARAASAELDRFFEGAASIGYPAGPPVGASQGVPGRSSGLSPPVRSLDSIKELKFGSYNVENLFEWTGSHIPDPANPGKLKKTSDARPKPEWAMSEEGRIIRENDLDIVTLTEVEDARALEDFNRLFLGDAYRTYLIEGNDERGIDIAFLVKKDLPFAVEQRSHKGETWIDPVLGGGPKTLFSRDLTSLIVRAHGKAAPLFILFGTHYKSKRDRGGDPQSTVLRTAQVQLTAEILERYREEFGADIPLMLAGDFNGSVGKEPAYDPLFKAAGLTDSFDAVPLPVPEQDRITHTYHPRGAPTQNAQMDAVLVSKRLRGTVKSAQVYRYKDLDGTERPIPKTYAEREKNPSDHFPLIVTLDFAPIRAGVFPPWTTPPKKP